MEENKNIHAEGGDKEILYSKAIKAGKRIYYLDVKRNLKDDLFLAITESKKVQPKSGSGAQVAFEKHKIFLYKEDFEKFLEGMSDVMRYIALNTAEKKNMNLPTEDSSGEIKLDIEF
ncbi:MAG: DUF3276 family protein [Parabacteroides sp.]